MLAAVLALQSLALFALLSNPSVFGRSVVAIASAIVGVPAIGLALIWWFLQVSWSGRVSALLATAAEIADGRFERRVEVTDGGELGHFATTLNTMAAELQLHATERGQLDAIFKNVSGVLFCVDIEGPDQYRFVAANPAFLDSTGLTMDRVLGKLVSDVIPEPSLTKVLAHYRSAIASRETVRWDEMSVYPKGVRYGEVAVTPIVSGDGVIRQLIGVVHDVTDRKLAENDLKEHLDFLPLAVGWTDADGCFVYMNRRHLEVFGYSLEDTPTLEAWRQRAYPDEAYRDRIVAAWNSEVLRAEAFGGTIGPVAERIVCKDGKVKEMSVFGRQIGSRQVGVFVDLTEHLALERQLRQVQKLESIGQLAGGVAHDFNNLLTIINGYADVLFARIDASDPLLQPVAAIRTAGSRAAELTGKLLTFSRTQEPNAVPTPLKALIADHRDLLQRLLREDVQLEVNLRTTGLVMADPGLFYQVLMNLAVNARQAMPHGGRLTIEATDVELTERRPTEYATLAPGSYVSIVVRDIGIGIDPTVVDRIFDPFFTTKSEGTGLGLSIVYSIVRQAGGTVTVKSHLGLGTEFTILWPRLSGEVVADAHGASSLREARGHETVLVVEDQDAVRAFVVDVLSDYGYRVVDACSGEQALEILERGTESIDLLLTDVVMPHLSGPELVEKVRATQPDLRVLFMSGFVPASVTLTDPSDIRTGHIAKPFKARALTAKVREILAQA